MLLVKKLINWLVTRRVTTRGSGETRCCWKLPSRALHDMRHHLHLQTKAKKRGDSVTSEVSAAQAWCGTRPQQPRNRARAASPAQPSNALAAAPRPSCIFRPVTDTETGRTKRVTRSGMGSPTRRQHLGTSFPFPPLPKTTFNREDMQEWLNRARSDLAAGAIRCVMNRPAY